MTLTEVVVSAVILGISSQASLHGWSRTSQAAATSAYTDQQVRFLEQRLLASRRALASAPVDDHLSSSWSFDSSADGLWLSVELTDADASISLKRSQLFTPAGLGHCPRELSDAQ